MAAGQNTIMTRVENIIKDIKDGSSAKDISERYDCHIMNVYGIAKRYGLKLKSKPVKCEVYGRTIRDLARQGKSDKEIGRIIGTQGQTVTKYRLDNDIPTNYVLSSANKHTEFEVAELIKNKAPQLEYVSGYVDNTKPVKVRCKVCGWIFERRLGGIVTKGNTGCPECRRRKAEIKKQQDIAEKERIKVEQRSEQERQREAKIRALGNKIQVQIELNVCPVCGNLTTRPKYCSDKCAKKVERKGKEIKRRAKVRNAMVDKDITVLGLFKRDAGICYLCGKPCRLDDYVMQNGQKQCGDWYPSIDHVVPLSKGGKHSWDNVRLAHRICNSIKRDELVNGKQ